MLRETLRVLVGSEVESRVDIGLAKDGSGAGGQRCSRHAWAYLMIFPTRSRIVCAGCGQAERGQRGTRRIQSRLREWTTPDPIGGRLRLPHLVVVMSWNRTRRRALPRACISGVIVYDTSNVDESMARKGSGYVMTCVTVRDDAE